MNILKWIWKHYDLESELNNLRYENSQLKDELKRHHKWQIGYLDHINCLENRIIKLKHEICNGGKMKNSKISQLAYVNELSNGAELEKGKSLNVKQLCEVLNILVDEGYGDYKLRVGYDSDCASTTVRNQFDIMADTINFRERG